MSGDVGAISRTDDICPSIFCGSSVPTVGGNASTLYVREEFKSWKIHSKDVFSAAEQGASENSSMLVFFSVFSCDRFCFHTRTMFFGRLGIFRNI